MQKRHPRVPFPYLLDSLSTSALPASHILECSADIGQRTHGLDASIFQRSEFVVGCSLATGDDRTGVAHTLARRCGNTGNVGNHRLGDVSLDVGCGFLFSGTADFADHDDRFSLRILFEHLEDVDEAGARDRITTDTHTGGLAKTVVSSLFDRFISQGTGARHDTHFARQMDMARLNTDLAFTGSDHARAVRTHQAHAQLVTLELDVEHIECRNAFSNAHDQLDAGIGRFKDRVFAERGRYVDNTGLGAGLLDRLLDCVEHRQPQMRLSAFARRHATHHLSAVGDRLLGVEGSLPTRKALADNLGVLVDQDTHYLPSAALTTCSAASVRLVAAMMFRPLEASFSAPSSALVPSRRTTTGTLTPTCSTAPMMPSAIMSQRTMPPKMLTSTSFTLSSERISLNASATRPLVAPPPTSRKLAGEPPCRLTMSMVPMARPAPLTMQPMLPSSAT